MTDQRQQAIDTALSWMRNSGYVGGPSERDAWRKVLEVLGPFETERVGQSAPAPAPAPASPDQDRAA